MTTIEFNKKVKCGNEFVAVKIIENCEELKYGNIYLPAQTESNARLAFCQIQDIGKEAADKTGCKVGDYVMIDRLSTFSHTSPIATLKYDSVICKSNENKTDFFPLKDMLFVEPDDKEEITNLKGIYVQNSDLKLRTGLVIKTGFESSEEFPFKVGQKIMLTKGSDVVQIGNQKINIFKKDMIICSIED